MKPQIKQRIEEEALRRFPDDRSHPYRDRDNSLLRQGFEEGAECGYNIKESINVELKTALEYLLNCVTKDRFKCELQDAIPKAKEVLSSASNESKQESVNEKLLEALKEAQDELIKLKPVAKMPEDESFYLAFHKRNELLLSASHICKPMVNANWTKLQCNCGKEFPVGENKENNEGDKESLCCIERGNDERFRYNDQYSNGECYTCLDCNKLIMFNPPKEKNK